MSKIEWTDFTVNPAVGCTKISLACDHCYAERMAARQVKIAVSAPKYAGVVDDHGHWTGRVNLDHEVMGQCVRRKRPAKYFIGSMTDMFHRKIPFSFLDEIWTYMECAPQHIFQILTKRPDRMWAYIDRRINDMGRPVLPHAWLGITVESQEMADARTSILLSTPAAVRFVSCEPMLGPVNFRQIKAGCPAEGDNLDALTGCEVLGDAAFSVPSIDWVICGGETGPRARHMKNEWARSLRDQCVDTGVPFFFKKWGDSIRISKDNQHVLDGKTWEQFPGPAA